jgi:hypothetical protein
VQVFSFFEYSCLLHDLALKFFFIKVVSFLSFELFKLALVHFLDPVEQLHCLLKPIMELGFFLAAKE